MTAGIRARLKRIDAANLQYISFATGFCAVFALLAALWQMGLSAQMHFAPACSPDDTVRLSCTYTSRATVASVTPFFVTIRGGDFLTSEADLPLWSDTSFLHPGDVVTAMEWHQHLVSITKNGQTLAAQGNPDAGPVSWPGVLVFVAVFGSASLLIRELGKRTRVTIKRNFWGGAEGVRRESGGSG